MAYSPRLVAFFVTLIATSGAQAGQLQDLYQQAQANDASYLAAQHSLNAKLQIIPQAESAVMPQVSANFNQSLPLDARADSHNYSVQIVLPLRLDAYYGMKVAQQSAASARSNFEKSEQSLIFSVIERYFAVLKQQRQLASSQAELKAIQQRLKQTQQLVDVGLASNIQLQDVQANVQQLQVALLQTQQNLNLARTDVENLTNQPLTEHLDSLSADFGPQLIPNESLQAWFQLANANNLDIVSNGFSTQQAYHNYQAKDVGLYPKASISLAQAYSRSATLNTDTTTLSIAVSGTLYDGGLNKAQTMEAQENWHASQQQGAAIQRSALQQVRRWHQSLETNRHQIQAYTLLLASVQSSLSGKTKEYELGLRDISDLLDAEKLVFAAQRNLANAHLDLVLNQLRLKQVSGVLSSDDLAQLDNWLN